MQFVCLARQQSTSCVVLTMNTCLLQTNQFSVSAFYTHTTTLHHHFPFCFIFINVDTLLNETNESMYDVTW